MPWYELGGAVVFLANAVVQYVQFRRTATRLSLIVVGCSLLMVLWFTVGALSRAGWEPAMRLTSL